jgi:Lrp/AsnC family transcriptional regulator, leucine-responsive regulatory protein
MPESINRNPEKKFACTAACEVSIEKISVSILNIRMKIAEIDRTDKIILMWLQKQATMPLADLAAKAGIAASSCHRRVKLLEKQGIITGYEATLDRKALGLTNEFFVEVSLAAQTEEAFEKFEKAIQRMAEILECHLMSGQFDYLLRVAARDAEDYERVHRTKLARLPGVQRIQSLLALRTVKEWSGYPVL